MTQLPAIDPKDLQGLTPAELAEIDRLLTSGPQWRPLPGPQTLAYESTATVIGFGGSAGGGKTDLALGLALNKHQRVLLCRQNGTELLGIVDRLAQMLGTKDGYNGAERIWRTNRWDKVPVQIELGSFPAPGDAAKYQGRPHDLLVFDEASNMRLSDVRFLMGWLRTVDPSQPCRALMTFNPPTTSQGRWVIEYFGPWLDKKHPKPAQPGGAPLLRHHRRTRCRGRERRRDLPRRRTNHPAVADVHPLPHLGQPLPDADRLHGAATVAARAAPQPDALRRLLGWTRG